MIDPNVFTRALAKACAHVERTYGIPTIRIGDMSPGISGDLDGRRIFLAHDLGDEPALFAVLHLFGHCVQWSSSARARELGRTVVEAPSPDELRELFDYEIEAHDLGLQLLREIGEGTLDGWYAIESRNDLVSLMEHYTGLGPTPLDDTREDLGIRMPVAKPIPAFTPTEVGRRELGGRVIDFRSKP